MTDAEHSLIVSKSEYARMRGRSPAALSHWIREGKLTPPALIGSGRTARIDVKLADEQLATTLDIGQQLAQPAPVAANGGGLPLDDQARLRRAKVEREEIEARMARAREERELGRWLLAAEAEKAWRRELVDLLAGFELFLTSLAADLAAGLDVDVTKVVEITDDAFRAWRSAQADAAAKRAGGATQ